MGREENHKNFRNLLGIKKSESRIMNDREKILSCQLNQLDKEIGTIKQCTILNCSNKTLAIRELVLAMFASDERAEVNEILNDFCSDPTFSIYLDENGVPINNIKNSYDMDIAEVKEQVDKILFVERKYIDKLMPFADSAQKDQLDMMLGVKKIKTLEDGKEVYKEEKDINNRNVKEMLRYYFSDEISSTNVNMEQIENFESWKEIQEQSEKNIERYSELCIKRSVLQDKFDREGYKKANPLKYFANEIACKFDEIKNRPNRATLNPADFNLESTWYVKNEPKNDMKENLRENVFEERQAEENTRRREMIKNERIEIEKDEKVV